jgi:SAM-dependent methyltransferase
MSLNQGRQYNHDYDNKKRLAAYWHQVDECRALGGKSVLVVGKGSGLQTVMLERQGFEVVTLDIRTELRPAVTGDVRCLPFLDCVFDIAVCCQVLEHLRREFLMPSLRELRRVTRRGVVLSLPDRGRCSTLIPHLFGRREVLSLPSFWLKAASSNPEHLWEINIPGNQLHNIQHEIDIAGFRTERTFRVWEIPYHRFWRLTANSRQK